MQAYANAAADYSYTGNEAKNADTHQEEPRQEQNKLRERLDYKPRLSAVDVSEVISLKCIKS